MVRPMVYAPCSSMISQAHKTSFYIPHGTSSYIKPFLGHISPRKHIHTFIELAGSTSNNMANT